MRVTFSNHWLESCAVDGDWNSALRHNKSLSAFTVPLRLIRLNVILKTHPRKQPTFIGKGGMRSKLYENEEIAEFASVCIFPTGLLQAGPAGRSEKKALRTYT